MDVLYEPSHREKVLRLILIVKRYCLNSKRVVLILLHAIVCLQYRTWANMAFKILPGADGIIPLFERE